MKKLGVGIIGLGVGEKHLEAYLGNKSCEIKAICDFDSKKLKAVSKKYPSLTATENADDILNDQGINVASIASYDNYHYRQIVKAIEMNKHIFVEKPLCLYRKEAADIQRRLAKRPHLKLSSNLILRKSPRFAWLKKAIKQGKLGTIYHIEGDYNYGRLEKVTKGWRGKIPFYSVMYGGGVHIIDLILWLTEEKPQTAAAFGNKISSRQTQFKYNDIVSSVVQFQSGMTANIVSNYSCVFPHFHQFAVYGTKATFVNGLEHGLLFTSRNPSVKPEKITEKYPGVHKGDLINSFIQSIVDPKSKSDVMKDDVFKAMNLCFDIEEAMKTKKIVTCK
jgi:predicted dehydrogenase